MKNTIFYIDDEVLESEHYREKLELEFVVQHILNVFDGEVEVFKDQIVEMAPSLLIQDVMLPNRDGEINIERGVEILTSLKALLRRLHIPVIVFSNRISKELEAAILDLEIPSQLIKVLFKPNIGFNELPKEARTMIRKSRS